MSHPSRVDPTVMRMYRQEHLSRRQRMLRQHLRRIPMYLVLLFFASIFLFPLYYLFVLATHPSGEMLRIPPHLWFGTGLVQNLYELFGRIPFHLNIINSFGTTIGATLAALFFCTMGGFAFAKYEFKGKPFFFALVLAVMAIPPFLNMVPFFQIMATLGWINTWLPLIVPMAANPLGIFLMAQFLQTSIPDALMDAARIDGVSEIGMLRRIVFPLAKPAMAVLAIIIFVTTWNNFMGALVLMPSQRHTTIPVALSIFFDQAQGQQGALMVGSAIAVLPLLLVFVFFSRRIISGLTAGALHGEAA